MLKLYNAVIGYNHLKDTVIDEVWIDVDKKLRCFGKDGVVTADKNPDAKIIYQQTLHDSSYSSEKTIGYLSKTLRVEDGDTLVADELTIDLSGNTFVIERKPAEIVKFDGIEPKFRNRTFSIGCIDALNDKGSNVEFISGFEAALMHIGSFNPKIQKALRFVEDIISSTHDSGIQHIALRVGLMDKYSLCLENFKEMPGVLKHINTVEPDSAPITFDEVLIGLHLPLYFKEYYKTENFRKYYYARMTVLEQLMVNERLATVILDGLLKGKFDASFLNKLSYYSHLFEEDGYVDYLTKNYYLYGGRIPEMYNAHKSELQKLGVTGEINAKTGNVAYLINALKKKKFNNERIETAFAVLDKDPMLFLQMFQSTGKLTPEEQKKAVAVIKKI